MKKVTMLIIPFFLSLLLVSGIYAQDEGAPEPQQITIDDEVQNIAEPADPEPIEINLDETTVTTSDTIFTVYTHEDCPHCQNLEDFVDANGIGANVVYKQLKDNDQNMTELENIWEEFGATEPEQGWPFAVYEDNQGERQYAVGDEPIIDDMVTLLALENAEFPNGEPGTTTTDEGSNTLLIVIGGLFFAAVIGYGIYSYLSSPKDEYKSN